MGSVAIKHWSVASLDLTGMVQNDDLSVESLNLLGGVILGVRGNVASLDVLD